MGFVFLVWKVLEAWKYWNLEVLETWKHLKSGSIGTQPMVSVPMFLLSEKIRLQCRSCLPNSLSFSKSLPLPKYGYSPNCLSLSVFCVVGYYLLSVFCYCMWCPSPQTYLCFCRGLLLAVPVVVPMFSSNKSPITNSIRL